MTRSSQKKRVKDLKTRGKKELSQITPKVKVRGGVGGVRWT